MHEISSWTLNIWHNSQPKVALYEKRLLKKRKCQDFFLLCIYEVLACSSVYNSIKIYKTSLTMI